jgi:hypothetical protein
LHAIGLNRRALGDQALAERDDVTASDSVEPARAPMRQYVQVEVSLVRLSGFLVAARVFDHVARREGLESAACRFFAIPPLLFRPQKHNRNEHNM